jgi:hypothetical protein
VGRTVEVIRDVIGLPVQATSDVYRRGKVRVNYRGLTAVQRIKELVNGVAYIGR